MSNGFRWSFPTIARKTAAAENGLRSRYGYREICAATILWMERVSAITATVKTPMMKGVSYARTSSASLWLPTTPQGDELTAPPSTKASGTPKRR